MWKGVRARLRGNEILRLTKTPDRLGDRPNPYLFRGDRRELEIGAWGVGLPDSWEAFERERLGRSFSGELAKKNRRVAKRGTTVLAVAQTTDERLEVFDRLVRQRQARFEEAGRFNRLGADPFMRFYRAGASASELTNLTSLTVDGRAVATMFALRGAKARHVIMTTFEGGEEWKSCSLGNVLIQRSIQDLIAEGGRYFDLTIGDEACKAAFGASRRPLFEILSPLSPLGAAAGAALRLRRSLRELNRMVTAPNPRRASSGPAGW